jgi:hypothetical protein
MPAMTEKLPDRSTCAGTLTVCREFGASVTGTELARKPADPRGVTWTRTLTGTLNVLATVSTSGLDEEARV